MKSEKIIPWKLIFVVLLILIILFFLGFNLDNRTTISFGFIEITNISSALLTIFSLFFGFILGIVGTLLTKKKSSAPKEKKREKKKKKGEQKKNPVDITVEQ